MSFLAQDGRLALDQQPRALIAVGDDAVAEDETLAGFQLDFEAHFSPPPAAVC
jgi:hypothetical protein